MVQAPPEQRTRSGRRILWYRRVVDPTETSVVEGSDMHQQLLELDYDGRVAWREIAGPTPSGEDPRYVVHTDDEPLPDPNVIPFVEWRRDELHRYAVAIGVDLAPIQNRGEPWRKPEIIALIDEHAQKQQRVVRAVQEMHQGGDDDYADRSRAELLELAEERGIEATSRTTKPELVNRLRAWDRQRGPAPPLPLAEAGRYVTGSEPPDPDTPPPPRGIEEVDIETARPEPPDDSD